MVVSFISEFIWTSSDSRSDFITGSPILSNNLQYTFIYSSFAINITCQRAIFIINSLQLLTIRTPFVEKSNGPATLVRIQLQRLSNPGGYVKIPMSGMLFVFSIVYAHSAVGESTSDGALNPAGRTDNFCFY